MNILGTIAPHNLRRLSFLEQRGRWTDFNGTVPRLSIPRKSEKLSGLLLHRSWLITATIKHGDGYQAKSVEKVSHPSAKPFLHANSRMIGASTLNRRCFEVNIFAEIRLKIRHFVKRWNVTRPKLPQKNQGLTRSCSECAFYNLSRSLTTP